MSDIIDNSGTIKDVEASIELALVAVHAGLKDTIGKTIKVDTAYNGTEVPLLQGAKLGQITAGAYTITPTVMKRGILKKPYWGWILECATPIPGWGEAPDDLDLIEVGKFSIADDAAIALATHLINDMIYARFNAKASDAFAKQVAQDAKEVF